MKVKCITNYYDLQLKRDVEINEELDVTEARGKVLINAKVCEAVDEPTTPEVATEPAPKKRASKKKVEG